MLLKKKWCKDNGFFVNSELFAPLIFRKTIREVTPNHKSKLLPRVSAARMLAQEFLRFTKANPAVLRAAWTCPRSVPPV